MLIITSVYSNTKCSPYPSELLNSFENKQVSQALQSMSEEELKAYILMERIFPPTQSSYLLREGQLTKVCCLFDNL